MRRTILSLFPLLFIAVFLQAGPAASGGFKIMRPRMVEQDIRGRGVRDKKVLGAMTRIERHLFVDRGLMQKAYEDHPLPIDEGQTISQPYVVALMTEALRLKPDARVLAM